MDGFNVADWQRDDRDFAQLPAADRNRVQRLAQRMGGDLIGHAIQYRLIRGWFVFSEHRPAWVPRTPPRYDEVGLPSVYSLLSNEELPDEMEGDAE